MRLKIATLPALLACLALLPASAAALPAAGAGTAAAPGAGTSAASSAATPPRWEVLEVQRLFRVLGYPLGDLPLGGFGPRTQGALRYFQHKYGLPVTGLPDPRTLGLMRSVAATLRGPGGHGGAASAAPHDLVEDVLGQGVPILALAVACAALLGLLAISARERPA